MRIGVARLSAAGIALALALVSGSGRAAPPKENEAVKKDVARDYVIQGDAAFEKGDYAVALDRFERAERLVPAPTVLLRIGRVHIKLGHWIEAKQWLGRAATTDLPSDASPVLFKAVVEAQQELRALEPKIPSVRLVAPGKVTGVMVDGHAIAEEIAAKPLAIDPGAHQIAMDCCTTQQVTVAEGDQLTLRFVPKPKPEAPIANREPDNWGLIGGIALLGVGTVGLGLGVYESVKGLGYQDEFGKYLNNYTKDQNVCNIAAGNEPDHPISGSPLTAEQKASVTDVCNKADTARILQFVGYPLGVVGVGVGVTLLLLSRPSSPPSTSRIEVLPVWSSTYQGLVIRGAL